ncbi:hypothetical protein JB92DRAFT_2848245 [Gautieria morchelliformis]|nr:hypothetical protein JB92DRAFT_2848245 [Gautieria morchelliformis]
MEIQCLLDGPHDSNCLFVRGCCSNNGILDIAMVGLCGLPVGYDIDHAMTQYEINLKIALCHFDGHSVDNVQLLLTPNASAQLDSYNRQDERAIYRALQITGGHVGLPILLLFSIFSKTAQRDLTFLNFCFTWIFSSIAFSVGLYRLGPASTFSGVTLPFIHSDQECLNQAALVSGSQAMTDTAMCALIVQLWFDFRTAIHGPRSLRQIRWTRATVYLICNHLSLVFMKPFFTTTASGSALRGSTGVNFYCLLIDEKVTSGVYTQGPFLISQYTVLLSILIVTLIFDACIIHILYRRWRFFQQTGEKALGIPLSVAFRVIFCAYRLVVAVAYVATMLDTQGISALGASNEAFLSIPVWVDMLQAATPLVAFLIFGTSKEFLDALMFWRWFNPILATSMCCRRKSPVTRRASNVHGDVFDDESMVSGDSVLDIRQEGNTDECLPL